MLARELQLLVENALGNLRIHLRVTPKLCQSLLSLVKHEHEDVLVVHDAQFDALLDQPLLSLAKRDSHGLRVLDLLKLKRLSLPDSFIHLNQICNY